MINLVSIELFFVAELFKLGDFYGEEDLKQRCEWHLGTLLPEENFSAVYSVAVQHDAKVIKHMISLSWELFPSLQ